MTGLARNLRRGVASVAVLMVLGGCPKRFDPRAETVRASPDAEADHEYHEAKARLDIGDAREASTRFADFLKKHPTDPLAPSARIGQARAALLLNQPKKAKEVLEPVAVNDGDPTSARARYLYGITLHRTGDWAQSRQYLRPFAATIAGGDDAVELHAVLADDAAHLDDAEDALKEYSLFFSGARPAEKLYLRDRVSEVVAKLPPTEALRLWNQLSHDTVAAAYLGKRVAADRRVAGDERTAAAILDESRGARERAGLEEPKEARIVKKEGGRAIAMVLPLSGRQRALGERALRGALLAADLMAPPNIPGGVAIELKIRDTGSDPARAVAAVDDLARDGVVAIVGSPDRIEAQSAVPHAEQLGIPFLELAPDDARRGQSTFKLVRQSDDRARALARLAVKRGARSVAVLAPDSAYGRSMASAFVDEARRAGARIAGDVRYPETATTFIEPVRRIQQGSPEALFVPAPATQLQLIAPQLASSGLTRLPGVKPVGKMVQLYATADGLNEKLVQSTGKYLEGAILAPVFYADVNDARAAAFVERYRLAYGEEPSSLDALAYDAVRAARIALEHADGDRAALANSLSHLGENGLTGEIAFTAGGDRAGAPSLYTVDNGAVRAFK
ncbi:MAG: Extracellular ligand-binding receptor [Myxococcales bacterium]|nr:Extracellular ligand-binding receptor [Myxococcales bacterium]